MDQESWCTIPNFPTYSISSYGRVNNDRFQHLMATSLNNYGHVKISLYDHLGQRHTLLVARLVGEAFVRPPDGRSTSIAILDGDLENVAAWNLVWRPRWFAWQYNRQLRTPQPRYFEILPILNIIEDVTYPSIVDAGMAEGLLFKDIWRSTYSGNEVYPHRSIFTVLEKSIK